MDTYICSAPLQRYKVFIPSGGFTLRLLLLPGDWDLLEQSHGHKSTFMCCDRRVTNLHGCAQQCVGAGSWLLVKLVTLWWDCELWEKPTSVNLSISSTSLCYMKSHLILWALSPQPIMVQAGFLAAQETPVLGHFWGGWGQCLLPSVFPGWVSSCSPAGRDTATSILTMGLPEENVAAPMTAQQVHRTVPVSHMSPCHLSPLLLCDCWSLTDCNYF